MIKNKLKQKYKCPECNAEMEKGYVLSDNSIRWAETEEQGAVWGLSAETLTPKSYWKLTNPKCDGLRCKKCKIVIFREWEK